MSIAIETERQNDWADCYYIRRTKDKRIQIVSTQIDNSVSQITIQLGLDKKGKLVANEVTAEYFDSTTGTFKPLKGDIVHCGLDGSFSRQKLGQDFLMDFLRAVPLEEKS